MSFIPELVSEMFATRAYAPLSAHTSGLIKRLPLIGLCLLLGCSKDNDSPKVETRFTTRVKIADAVQTNLPVAFMATGHARAFATVAVRSQIDGLLTSIHFHEGDVVKAGALLFTFDKTPFEISVQRAKADLERDVALEKTAESEQQANKILLESKVISQMNYDQGESTIQSLRSSSKADEAILEAAQLALSNCSVLSPLTGRAGMLQVNPGNLIYGPDTVLLTINQTRPIYVDINVPERMLPWIRNCFAMRHFKVAAYLASQETPCATGEVVAIDNQVDTNSDTVLVRTLFTNENEVLWPGQTVKTVLTLNTWTNIVAVPSQAVRTDTQGKFVFVLSREQSLERRPVESDASLPGEMTFVPNVRPGEQVVIASPDQLCVGMQAQVEH